MSSLVRFASFSLLFTYAMLIPSGYGSLVSKNEESKGWISSLERHAAWKLQKRLNTILRNIEVRNVNKRVSLCRVLSSPAPKGASSSFNLLSSSLGSVDMHAPFRPRHHWSCSEIISCRWRHRWKNKSWDHVANCNFSTIQSFLVWTKS